MNSFDLDTEVSAAPGKVAGHGVLALLASVPWCCVLPALFSALSLGGAVVVRVWFMRFMWILLPLCLLFLGRAFWLLHVKRQGAPWSRGVTWGSAVLVIALWAPRIWAWFIY